MRRLRLATAWLSGCSGCHMSLLNLHEQLLELFSELDLVYSPLMDIKEFPCDVDIALVEGAVANQENLEMTAIIRERTRIVVSLGDCAVNSNVSGLRNPLLLADMLKKCFGETHKGCSEDRELLKKVLPLHQVIRVDAFIPGCPPEPTVIKVALDKILNRCEDV